MKKQARSGFTIIELLVVVSIIALLIGILLPALGRARDSALQTTSLSNLRQISAGLAAYAGDWNDRQPTLIPDDFAKGGTGVVGACQNYINNIHCMPQPILGWANIGGGRALWGYWIDNNGDCAGVGGCGNACIAVPYDSSDCGQAGYFRVMNHKLFSQYMNGRFYDEVFYAPKDRRKREKVEEFFDLPDEFSSEQNIIEWPSYCMAASAMIASDVAAGKRCTPDQDPTDNPDRMCAPWDFPGGWKSPPVGAAAYPDLKMRVWEHEWLQNAPAELNPAFTTETPYFFNHSPKSAPCTLMYDGSVRVFSANEAIQSNQRVQNQGGEELWINDWNGNDYYEGGSHGFPEEYTSFGVLTREGIKGKDTIGLEG